MYILAIFLSLSEKCVLYTEVRTKKVRTYARGYHTIIKTNVRLCGFSLLKLEKNPRKNIIQTRRVVGLRVGEFRFYEWSVYRSKGHKGLFYEI